MYGQVLQSLSVLEQSAGVLCGPVLGRGLRAVLQRCLVSSLHSSCTGCQNSVSVDGENQWWGCVKAAAVLGAVCPRGTFLHVGYLFFLVVFFAVFLPIVILSPRVC